MAERRTDQEVLLNSKLMKDKHVFRDYVCIHPERYVMSPREKLANLYSYWAHGPGWIHALRCLSFKGGFNIILSSTQAVQSLLPSEAEIVHTWHEVGLIRLCAFRKVWWSLCWSTSWKCVGSGDAFLNLALDGPNKHAPPHAELLLGKESQGCIENTAWWDPEPVWTLRKPNPNRSVPQPKKCLMFLARLKFRTSSTENVSFPDLQGILKFPLFITAMWWRHIRTVEVNVERILDLGSEQIALVPSPLGTNPPAKGWVSPRAHVIGKVVHVLN